ncbi:MAG: hypothetical protein IT384_28260 [Deltaproteobacteria bacterium]|nr:hypothetical protein [Deltaproteobacteria bacterium]
MILAAPALLLALSLPAAGNARTFERVLAEAEEARAAGAWERSLELLEEAFAIEARPELLNNMGRALEALGRYASAVERYRQVVENPRAPAELRALDRTRIAALEPKLSQAHLRAEGSLEIWIDGVALGSEERSVTPGPHQVEVYQRRRRRVVLRLIEPRIGESTLLGAEQLASDPSQASLTLPVPGGAVGGEGDRDLVLERLVIDGYALRAPLGSLLAVDLPGGAHRISASAIDGRSSEGTLDVGPGSSAWLGRLFRSETVPPSEAIATPIATPAAVQIPPEVEAPGPPLASWLAGSVGVAAGVAGAVLLLSASADRAEVTGASTDASGVITGVTYREAEALEGSANTKSIAGGVVIGTGAAALATALVLAILD